jgi:hypothetical protein
LRVRIFADGADFDGIVEMARHAHVRGFTTNPTLMRKAELLNVFQADEAGVHIIGVSNDILKKLPLVGRDLDAYSLETVRMVRNDAVAAGFSIDRAPADVS